MDEKARELIADHLGVSRALILDHMPFRELGADSLDLVSLTMAFEEAFDLRISDEQAEGCVAVGDALALLCGKPAGQVDHTEDRMPETADALG